MDVEKLVKLPFEIELVNAMYCVEHFVNSGEVIELEILLDFDDVLMNYCCISGVKLDVNDFVHLFWIIAVVGCVHCLLKPMIAS